MATHRTSAAKSPIRIRLGVSKDRISYQVLDALDAVAQRKWVLEACDMRSVVELAPKYAAELGLNSPTQVVESTSPAASQRNAATREVPQPAKAVTRVTDLGFDKDSFLSSLATAFEPKSK